MTAPLDRPSTAPRWLIPALLACYVVWGSTYPAIRFALVSFPPYFQMGSRFVIAGALLMAWMRWRGAAWPSLTGAFEAGDRAAAGASDDGGGSRWRRVVRIWAATRAVDWLSI